MRTEVYHGCERVSIDPGEYYSTVKPGVISTLLGSCVAACLYDPKKQLIGMNHFMLSNSRYSREMPIHISEAGRYGIHAMELLINDMMGKGTNRRMLRAKVFGGATISVKEIESSNFMCVGQVNSKFIREYLASEGIPVDAEDLEGSFGRVIHFSNGDFSVQRRKISHNNSRKLVLRDRDCWQNSIENQLQALPSIELW